MQANPAAIRPRATYSDLLALPENLVGELIDGELYAMPRPRARHAQTNSALGGDIFGAFGRRTSSNGPGGWIILDEPELHLGTPDANALVLVPDIAGWRRERMPEVPDVAAFELVPDWVCEVLSPGNASHDRLRKMEWYGRCGVRWAWIVDSALRSVEVYERDGATWRFHGGVEGSTRARIQPFDAVEFDISEWWAPVEPPTSDRG